MRRRDFLRDISYFSALPLGLGQGSEYLRAESGLPSAQTQNPQVLQQGNTITLENALVRRTVSVGPQGSLSLDALKNVPTGFDWAAPGPPTGMYLEMGNASFTGFEPDRGFRFLGSHEQKLANGAVQVQIDFLHDTTQMKITSFNTLFPDTPFLEFSVKIENKGTKRLPAIQRFDPLTLWLPGESGPLWTYWLQDPGKSSANDLTPRVADLFTLRRQTLDEAFAIAGDDGSMPWLILENEEKREFLFVGIGWTVDWGIRLLRKDGRVLLTTGALRSVHELEPGGELESPKILLGLVHGGLDDVVNAWHTYLRDHILPPAPKDYPWVSYNIWYTEPGDMEGPLKQEADFAADLGVECFYHDASWYEGADTVGSGLWGQGLGSYQELKSRFPNGMRSLSDHVHSKGMKFGVWVDPPNIDPVNVGSEVPAKWLAQHDGVDWVIRVDVWKPDPGLKRLCLGCPEVVEYLKKSLARIIEAWNVDWLKWDPSGGSPFQQPCNRVDHGHQKGNGTFAAIRGEDEIFRYLFESFPKLVIERCQGLDGLARYARNYPVSYDECPRSETQMIRHRVIGASYWFPGGFGQSYLWDRPDPIANRPDLAPIGFLLKPNTTAYWDNLFRSLMMTGFGFGTLDGSMSQRISRWHPAAIQAARRNIAAFKKYRHLLSGNVYHLLPQTTLYVPDGGESGRWDMLEYANREGSEAVAFFFRGGSQNATLKMPLRGLRADGDYTVTSFNSGRRRTVSANALLQTGVEINLPEKESSEILQIGPHS